MAVKPLRIILLIVILIAAGVGTTYIVRSRLYHERQRNTKRFVEAYVALSVARERHASSPESLPAAFDSIYAAIGIDSARMDDFANSLGSDIHRSRLVWERIVARLDTLRISKQAETPP